MTEILLDYERPGKSRLRYRERLIQDRPGLKVLAMHFTGASDLIVGGEPVLQPGSPMVWFIFPGQWYDIGRFYLADNTFTGFYTNLCTPVVMQGTHWSTTDLFLDLWIPAHHASVSGAAPTLSGSKGRGRRDRGEVWLDEEEFDHARARDLLPPGLADAAVRTRAEIDSFRSKNLWPPRPVVEWKDVPA